MNAYIWSETPKFTPEFKNSLVLRPYALIYAYFLKTLLTVKFASESLYKQSSVFVQLFSFLTGIIG